MTKLKSTLVAKLLEEYRSNKQTYAAEKIVFSGQGERDVYNISSSFYWKDETYILGRMEPRESELSDVGIFRKVSNLNYELTKYVLPLLQDPFFAYVDKELFIGGTELFINREKQINGWHTSIYNASDFNNIFRLMTAPCQMKDVRIFQDGKFYVFTRPQGKEAKLGRIGMEVFSNADELYRVYLNDAKLFSNQFDDFSWGGVNQILKLKNGWLGILGHIATMSEGDVRHYYAMTFALNPIDRKETCMKIICERSDFPDGEAKRQDLVDVIFPGGIVRNPDGTASIYTGLSDAEAYRINIEDPFVEYEI